MQHVDAASMARGYAEILCADGATSLLRLHAAGDGRDAQEEHLYYAVAQNDEVVFVSEEADHAAKRFDRMLRERLSDTGSGSEREDFLATTPMRLPRIRGEAYHRLAAQVSHLSGSQEPETHH
jgi:hypothetical protein